MAIVRLWVVPSFQLRDGTRKHWIHCRLRPMDSYSSSARKTMYLEERRVRCLEVRSSFNDRFFQETDRLPKPNRVFSEQPGRSHSANAISDVTLLPLPLSRKRGLENGHTPAGTRRSLRHLHKAGGTGTETC